MSSTFWISFFVFIAVIPIGIIVLGILATRKFSFLQKIINKDNTEIFAGLLYISSFLLEFFFKDKGFIEEIQKENQENALQEQEAESLDAQEQAEDGEEVGEGDA